MDYDYDTNKVLIGISYIEVVVNAEETNVRIEQYCGCLWIFFGAKRTYWLAPE